jgi:hypothetical protein
VPRSLHSEPAEGVGSPVGMTTNTWATGDGGVKPPPQELSTEPHMQQRRIRHPFRSTKAALMRQIITKKRLGSVDAPDYYQEEK